MQIQPTVTGFAEQQPAPLYTTLIGIPYFTPYDSKIIPSTNGKSKTYWTLDP